MICFFLHFLRIYMSKQSSMAQVMAHHLFGAKKSMQT